MTYFELRSIVFSTIALLIIPIVIIQGYEFSKDHFGVSFSPYAKNFEGDGRTPVWSSYSMEDVRTMIKVVSTRFSRIATYSAGANGKFDTKLYLIVLKLFVLKQRQLPLKLAVDLIS